MNSKIKTSIYFIVACFGLLSMSVSANPTWYYSQGTFLDGYDYPAQSYSNTYEAWLSFNQYYDSLDEISMVIIDSGIDPGVWWTIEDKGGDVSWYVQIDQGIPQGYFEVGTSAYAEDANGHGSHVSGTIWQIAQKAKLIVINVAEDLTPPIDKIAYDIAMQWINDNRDTYNILTVSMSAHAGGSASSPSHWDEDPDGNQVTILQNVQSLYQQGVMFFGAATNGGQRQSALYPMAYTEVYGIGSHDYSGYKSASSTYGPWLDFVAPIDSGIDSIVQCPDSGVNCFGIVDKSSTATPYVAGIATILRSVNCVYTEMTTGTCDYGTPQDIYDVMKHTAELKVVKNCHPWITEYCWYTSYDKVNTPKLSGWLSGAEANQNKIHREKVGWGTPDLYDAIKVIIGQL